MSDQHEAADPGEALLTVLRDLLNNESITAEDDYYAVGGHSMLVVQVIRRLRKDYGLVLSARAFAMDARVGALAGAVEVRR